MPAGPSLATSETIAQPAHAATESPMRHLLIPALALALGGAAYAADEAGATPKTEAKAEAKAVNTIDPNTGDKVDPKIAPVEGKTKDGKTVLIGASSAESEAIIKKDPAKFADAAVANKKVESK
jgi:hypothetical protein